MDAFSGLKEKRERFEEAVRQDRSGEIEDWIRRHPNGEIVHGKTLVKILMPKNVKWIKMCLEEYQKRGDWAWLMVRGHSIVQYIMDNFQSHKDYWQVQEWILEILGKQSQVLEKFEKIVDKNGMNFLHNNVDNPRMIKLLLKANWNPNLMVKQFAKDTLLHLAVKKRLTKSVETILSFPGASPINCNSLLQSPLHYAVHYNDFEMAKYLIQMCPECKTIPDRKGNFPIDNARNNNRSLEFINLLQYPQVFSGKTGKSIQVASDLHLEFYRKVEDTYGLINPVADYLLLAGDIGVLKDWKFGEFLKHVAKKFERIFIVTGNHEFYHENCHQVFDKMDKLCKEAGSNVIHLEKRSFLIPTTKIRILGTILWSEIPNQQSAIAVMNHLNDYRCIMKAPKTPITATDTHQWYQNNLYWLKTEIQKAKNNGEQVIVMTHHAPVFHGCSYADYIDPKNLTNAAFSTNLTNLLKENDHIAVWVFGHTHHCQSYITNKCRVISNAAGYQHTLNKNYSPQLKIDL